MGPDLRPPLSGLQLSGLVAPGVEAGSLHIAHGACTALSGPSGSGKTRLLRVIADLDPSQGEVWLDGVARTSIPAPEWRRRVIYLAAESQWWDPLVGPHAAAWSEADLDALGFAADVLDWTVSRLSSGERQRLALARALARAPQALLLDEPTANLDADNTTRVEQLVAAWRRASGGCALWVSHDPAQRARVASAAFEMHEGRLEPVAEQRS